MMATIQPGEIVAILAGFTAFLTSVYKIISAVNRTIAELKTNVTQIEDLKAKFDRLDKTGSQPMQEVLTQLQKVNTTTVDTKEKVIDTKEKVEGQNGGH